MLTRLDARAGATVAMSIGSLDDSVRCIVEPGTPPARSRLAVLARLSRAGIRTGVMIAPILPFLTDREEQLSELIEACAAAGAKHVTGVVLHIRPGIRTHFWPWLERMMPDIYPRYRGLYGGCSNPPGDYRVAIADVLSSACARAGLEGTPTRLMPQQQEGKGSQLSLAV